ncbi:MAG: circularly permuted type 2 ATP-grasp protein, partial [Minicystis sp.]
MEGLFARYPVAPGSFDELIAQGHEPHPDFRRVVELLGARSPGEFARAQGLAELALLHQGVTFSVYSDNRGAEKIFPFCLVPRLVSWTAFRHLQRGLEQRVHALGLFLDDIYGAQKILGEKPLLRGLVLGAKLYLPKLRGVRPAGGVRIHIAGIDLIRDHEGTFRVLEDNLRVPSGVSYMLENRKMMMRLFP